MISDESSTIAGYTERSNPSDPVNSARTPPRWNASEGTGDDLGFVGVLDMFPAGLHVGFDPLTPSRGDLQRQTS